MLDIRFIRENPDKVRWACRQKGEDASIDSLLELDERRRKLVSEVDSLRAERNRITHSIKEAFASSDKDAGNVLREKARKLSDAVRSKDDELKLVEKELNSVLLKVPNIPDGSVQEGKDENDNIVVREWGEKPHFDFEPKDHLQIGAMHNLFDMRRAAKITGAFFPLYRGAGAKLERALVNFMLDTHTENGYTEILPPFLSNRASMTGTGQLPKLEEDMYRVEQDDLFLIPTGEVPITNYFREEIIDEDALPMYFCGYTPCFRREAGSYGKKTKGLVRVHQFNKVELVKFVVPEHSCDELEALVADAERVLQLLGLHYRVVRLCTGELSFASAKTYDIEVWAPGIKRYLEVSSCSNFEDFQARRSGIRFRRRSGKPEFVHTLNGSGVATPRLMIALLETGQRRDGSIVLPEALAKYFGQAKIDG